MLICHHRKIAYKQTSFKVFLRNFLQLQDGLSGKRNCALLQNSKLSPVSVSTKNRNGLKVKSFYAAVLAKDESAFPH